MRPSGGTLGWTSGRSSGDPGAPLAARPPPLSLCAVCEAPPAHTPHASQPLPPPAPARSTRGSTLALAYAERHPDRVTELVLRGIFMLRKKEIDWYYENKGGAEFVFPDEWERYLAPVPPAERGSLVKAYNRMLTSDDREERMRAAKAWTTWEMATSFLMQSEESLAKGEEDEFAEAFARIENHYFTHEGWFRPETCAQSSLCREAPRARRSVSSCAALSSSGCPAGSAIRQLLDDVGKIRHIPCVIVQGRYDVVGPGTRAPYFPAPRTASASHTRHRMTDPGGARLAGVPDAVGVGSPQSVARGEARRRAGRRPQVITLLHHVARRLRLCAPH